MSVLGGALSYRKQTNDFYVNSTGTNDGWTPLPISVGAENLTREDLESWAQKLGGQNQSQVFVDKGNPLASDSKENRGTSRLRPFRTLERALLEVARTSIKKGTSNDLYERVSISVAPGEYDIYNGPSDLLNEFENYGRYQDAANLIGRNRTYIIQSAYNSVPAPYRSDLFRTDLTYFLNALVNDLTTRGNYYTLSSAKTLISKDPNLLTEDPPVAGYFISRYADVEMRIEAIAALEELKIRAIEAMRNLGMITDVSISVDPANPTCADVADTITTLINVLKDTLGCVIDPRNPGLVNYGAVSRGSFPAGEPTRPQLQAFNSLLRPGVVLPRGVSIIGDDLRKVVFRPTYVPDPSDPQVGRGAIFRMTGGNFFSGFTIKDSEGKNFSHHKLSAFEFCNDSDLNIYYDQVRLAFNDPSIYYRALDAANLLERNATWIEKVGAPSVVPAGYLNYAKIFEAEITNFLIAVQRDLRGLTTENVKEFGLRFHNAHIIPLPTTLDKTNAKAYYSGLFDDLMPFVVLAITNEGFTEDGGYQDNSVIIDPGSTFVLHGTTYSGRCADVQAAIFTLKEIAVNRIEAAGEDGMISEGFGDNDAEARFEESSIVLGLNPTNPPDLTDVNPALINTVIGASPYIFNASLRSAWGLCGLDGDGAEVSGLRSYLAAQFTIVSLQKDPGAFAEDINEVGGKRFRGALAEDAIDWRHFGYRVRNDAYAQLVSCFCIGPALHYLNESGAEFSITNSTSNFGDVSLYSRGFRDDGLGGGAYPQDRGYKVVSIKKPKPLSSLIRKFVLGEVDFIDAVDRRVFLTAPAELRGYSLVKENTAQNTKLYVRLANGDEISARITAEQHFGNQSILTLDSADFAPWGAQSLVGSRVFIKRYADFRSFSDKRYSLIVESDHENGNRDPNVNFIIRKSSVVSDAAQPFKSEWDEGYGRGKVYFIETVAPLLSPSTANIGVNPSGSKRYFEITALSAYANQQGDMEYRSNLEESADLNLDLDPEYIDLDAVPENNISYKSTNHILRLLGVTLEQLPATDFEISEERFVALDQLNLNIDLNKPSTTRCSGQTWEYMGYYNYATALPELQTGLVGSNLPILLGIVKRLSKVQSPRFGGRIYATGMDELGNFYQGYRITNFKTGESSMVNPGDGISPFAENFVPNEVIFPDYYPSMTIDNLVVNDNFTFNGQILNLPNDPVILAENGLTIRVGGVDVLSVDEVGNIIGGTIAASGATVLVSAIAPVTRLNSAPLENGDVWFNSSNGLLFVYYQDVDSSQWVELSSGGSGGGGIGGAIVSDLAPSTRPGGSPLESGDLWFDSGTAEFFIRYDDGVTAQWVAINGADSIPDFDPAAISLGDNNKYITSDTKPTERPGGVPLISGDKWYNPTTGVEGFWNGTNWLGPRQYIRGGGEADSIKPVVVYDHSTTTWSAGGPWKLGLRGPAYIEKMTVGVRPATTMPVWDDSNHVRIKFVASADADTPTTYSSSAVVESPFVRIYRNEDAAIPATNVLYTELPINVAHDGLGLTYWGFEHDVLGSIVMSENSQIVSVFEILTYREIL